MPATIQKILKPKKYRIKDTSSSLQPTGEELLTNGNMATDTGGLATGWASGNTSNDTESITSGNGFPANAQKVISGGDGSGGGANTFIYQEIGTLDNYSTYEISYYQRSSHGCAAYIVEQSPNDPHLGTQGKSHAAIIGESDDHASKHTWQFQTAGSTGTTYIRFYNRSTGATDSVSGDIIEIGQVSLRKCSVQKNNYHGELYSGRALEFDGVADDLEIPGGAAGVSGINAFEHTNGDAFTMACWINAASDSLEFYVGRNESSVMMFYIDPTSGGFKLGYRPDGAPSGNGLVDGNPDDSGDSYFDFATTVLPLNTWLRVVYVGTGVDSTVHCYVNGQLYGSLNADSTNRYNDFYFYRADLVQGYKGIQAHLSNIGSPYSTDLAHAYKGMMSDFQIWDSAWSASDVTYDHLNPESLALNNGSTSLAESNLKIWYPMNEGHKGQSFIMDAANTGLGDELVNNGDLSSGTTGYIVDSDGPGATMSVSTEQTYGGNSQSLKFVVGGAGDGVRASMTGKYYSGVTYKVSAWIYTSNTVTVNPDNSYFADSANTVNSSVNNEWVEIVCYMTCDSPSSSNPTDALYIQTANSGTTTFYLGQLSIKPVSDKHHATTVFTGDDGWNKADNYVEKGTNKWDDSLASNLTSNSGGATIGADIEVISTGAGQDAAHMGVHLIPGMASSGIGIYLNNSTSGTLSSTMGDMVPGRDYRLDFTATTGSGMDISNFAVHNGASVVTSANSNITFTNLISDYDFSAGDLSSWAAVTGATYVNSGKINAHSAQLVTSGSGSTVGHIKQAFTTEVGSQYLVTFWAKGGGSTNQNVRLQVTDNGDDSTVIINTTPLGTATSWVKYNYQFTAGHTSTKVWFYSGTADGTVYVDAVKVTKFIDNYIDFTAGHATNAYLYAKDQTTSKSTSNSVTHLSVLETDTTGWIKYPEDGAQAAAANVDTDGAGGNDATKFTAVGSNQWFGRNTSDITLEAGHKYQVQAKIFIPASTSDYATANGDAFIWWDTGNSDVVQTIQREALVASHRGSWYTSYLLLDCTGLDSSHDLTARLYLRSQNATTAGDFIYAKNIYIYRMEHMYVDNITIKQKGIASGYIDADRQKDIPQIALQSYSNLGWFEGADERLYPDENYTPTDSLTCAFWVFLNGADGENRGLIDNINWLNSGWRITADNSNRLQLQTSSGSGSDDGSVNSYVTTATTMTRGKWIHCAVAFNKTGGASGGHRLYINGEDAGSNASNTNGAHTMTQVARQINIGYGGGLTQSYHDGTFADVSIWNAFLTADDVRELYNDGKMLDQTTHSAHNFEMLTNGNFDGNLNGWTLENTHSVGDGLPYYSNGNMVMNSGGDGFCRAKQVLTTVAGVTYSVTGHCESVGTSNVIEVGTSNAAADLLNQTVSSTGDFSYTFTATGTTTYFQLEDGASGAGSVYSSISVKAKRLVHYWRNDGPGDWIDRVGSYDMEWKNTSSNGPPKSTILLSSSADGSTDSGGFFLNKKRETSSLNWKGDVLVTTSTSDTVGYVRNRNYLPFAESGFTMSYWLKVSDFSGRGIVGMNDGKNHRMYIGQTASGSTTALFGCGNGYNSVTSAIPLNKWVHLAQTWDGTNQKLFVNGIYKATYTQMTGTDLKFTGQSVDTFGVSGFNSSGIGESAGSIQYPVRGFVDDVLIYDRAVSIGNASIDELAKGEMGRIFKSGKRSHKID